MQVARQVGKEDVFALSEKATQKDAYEDLKYHSYQYNSRWGHGSDANSGFACYLKSL